MQVIRARNVHEILPKGVKLMEKIGVRRGSRNGGVLQIPEPVTSVYEKPNERVMFWPERDSNPFFHLLESLWMLAGRDDVEFVAWIVASMANFSDDGVTLHGAYGKRWLTWFGKDQIDAVIRRLKENPEDRRNVIQMWDARSDCDRQDAKDVPCNTQAYVGISTTGELDLTVCCRSNDMVWGAYGANAVHFSVMLEYMARSIGVEVGKYTQISNNFHAYDATYGKVKDLANQKVKNPYETGEVSPIPLFYPLNKDLFDADLVAFFEAFDDGSPISHVDFKTEFFKGTIVPAFMALSYYKGGDKHAAIPWAETVEATDWRKAMVEWLKRRK